jgi:hypothetical protein
VVGSRRASPGAFFYFSSARGEAQPESIEEMSTSVFVNIEVVSVAGCEQAADRTFGNVPLAQQHAEVESSPESRVDTPSPAVVSLGSPLGAADVRAIGSGNTLVGVLARAAHADRLFELHLAEDGAAHLRLTDGPTARSTRTQEIGWWRVEDDGLVRSQYPSMAMDANGAFVNEVLEERWVATAEGTFASCLADGNDSSKFIVEHGDSRGLVHSWVGDPDEESVYPGSSGARKPPAPLPDRWTYDLGEAATSPIHVRCPTLSLGARRAARPSTRASGPWSAASAT